MSFGEPGSVVIVGSRGLVEMCSSRFDTAKAACSNEIDMPERNGRLGRAVRKLANAMCPRLNARGPKRQVSQPK